MKLYFLTHYSLSRRGKSQTRWSQECREELSDFNSPVSSLLHRKRGGGWFLPCIGGLCLLSCSPGSRKHRLLTQQPAVIQDSLESVHWYLAELPWHEWAASVPSSFLCWPRQSNPSWRLAVVTTWERPVLRGVCSGLMSQSRSPCGKEVGLTLGEPRREGRVNILAYTNNVLRMPFLGHEMCTVASALCWWPLESCCGVV